MKTVGSAAINVARMTFVLLCLLAGMAIVLSTHSGDNPLPMWLGILGGLLVAGFMILVEALMKGFTLRGFSSATFGLLIGLFCAWLLSRVQVERLLVEAFSMSTGAERTTELAVQTILYSCLGFVGTALALRTSHEDFAFVVPYVRFRRDSSTGQPVVVDAETWFDGRLPSLLASGFLRGRSPSGSRSVGAQRALEQIESLQDSKDVEVVIHDSSLSTSAESMEARLIETAQSLDASLLTVDSNLAKAGKVRGANVLNINDLTEALKPSVEIGQRMRLPLVRPGKDDHQAVGYLLDGTMIVVNHAISLMGTSQDVRVISMIQTSAGHMVFAELITNEEAAA